MNFSLGHPPDVVVGRVGGLFHEHQGDPLEQLVPGHGGDGKVEEESVKDGDRDVVHGAGDKMDRGSDQDVGN